MTISPPRRYRGLTAKFRVQQEGDSESAASRFSELSVLHVCGGVTAFDDTVLNRLFIQIQRGLNPASSRFFVSIAGVATLFPP